MELNEFMPATFIDIEPADHASKPKSGVVKVLLRRSGGVHNPRAKT